MARRTSTAISKTDRLARQVAAAMAKGRSPRSSNELEDYFSRSPREVFTALAGFVSSMPPVGNGKDLGYGYLFLLQGLLLHLRYRIDRGYPDARGLVEEFQTAVAAGVREGSIAGSLLGLLAGVLQQAGVAASPVLIDASTALADRSTGRVSESDLDEVLAELIEACGGDPFVLVASGEEASHAMPQEARVALVTSLALARDAVARSAAVLFLLDPSPEIRIAAVGALAQVCAALSPTDLRRLIAIRDWRPEQECAAIDALVSRAREAGVDEAPWPGRQRGRGSRKRDRWRLEPEPAAGIASGKKEPAVVDSGQEWRCGCLCRRRIFPSSNRLDAGEGGP